MPASTYAGNAILNLFLRGVPVTPPARVWVSLHTDNPGNSGANEVTAEEWPAYQRLDAAQGDDIEDGFSPASSKATVNEMQLLYARNDGPAPVTVTHFVVWDSAEGGNSLVRGPLVNPTDPDDAAPKTINPTDECVIYAGEMAVAVV